MAHSRSSSGAEVDMNYTHFDYRQYDPDTLSTVSVTPRSSVYSDSSDYRIPAEPASITTATTRIMNQQSAASVHTTRKAPSLANIAVPSFSAFRSQASSIPIAEEPTPRARAVTYSRSPRAASFSRLEKASPRFADPVSRPLSLDSPLPSAQSYAPSVHPAPPMTEARPNASHTSASHRRAESIDSLLAGAEPAPLNGSNRRSSIPIHTRYAHDLSSSHAPQQSISSIIDFHGQSSPVTSEDKSQPPEMESLQHVQSHTSVKSIPLSVNEAPSMTLKIDGVKRTLSDESWVSESSQREARPKSPGGRFGNFFGWKSSPQRAGTESPTTTFSDRAPSPLPSPGLLKTTSGSDAHSSMARLTPPANLDTHRANHEAMGTPLAAYFDTPGPPSLLESPTTNAHVKELEKELAHISTELAGSIKREMELEDELERLRLEGTSLAAPNADEHSSRTLSRRGSDYFSDSGASAVRWPIPDVDTRIEQLEQKLRKAELEKAQGTLDMAARLQDELSRRRDMEETVYKLEERLQARDNAGGDRHVEAQSKLSELQSTLEETRRRLVQERQAKDQFGDLYSAARLEIEQHRNERDNLRDEVVPQLKARIEGLELEQTDTQALVYENTRVQQELAALKEKSPRFGSIIEEGVDGQSATSPGIGLVKSSLSRSGSLARGSSKRGASLTRSGSVKERGEAAVGSGRPRSGSNAGLAVTVDGFKEIEDQRDALHKALQLLIRRHEQQRKDHEREIHRLSAHRLPAQARLSTGSDVKQPIRSSYRNEVAFLKEEVTTLRRRTEDALEHKYEYEKGLAGLKLDLDRAEQESRSLRGLLQSDNLVVPRSRSNVGLDEEEDYSLLEDDESPSKLSIADAERERDRAKQLADALLEQDHSGAAQRLRELADEMESQIEQATQIRARLSEAVTEGESEQRASTRRIEAMQKRLASMEDSILAAQQYSETTLATHESEVRKLDNAKSSALQRLPNTASPSARTEAAIDPRLLSGLGRKLQRQRLKETSLLEASRTQMLERKVKEMEALLKEAEDDVQTVMQQVNRRQGDVAAIQMERDAAVWRMKALKEAIEEEGKDGQAVADVGPAVPLEV